MGSTPRPDPDPEGEPTAVFDLGSVESFEDFYRRELPALVAFAGALSGSGWAEDIAQEAMLAAYRRWNVVGRMDVPAAWVRRACANRAVSTVRRRSVEARAMLRLGVRRDDDGDPMVDEHEAFWVEVRRLPRRQSQVIALHYIYDLGVAEIATTLGCAEGTVKAHLSRGRTALGNRFAKASVQRA